MPQRRPFSHLQTTYLILKLLVVIGLRIGDLTGLNIKDVFSQDTKIRVMGKGSNERIVFVANVSAVRGIQAVHDVATGACKALESSLYQSLRQSNNPTRPFRSG